MVVNRKELIAWRRREVLELLAKQHSQVSIAKQLNVCEATVCKDIEFLREEAREYIKHHIDQALPLQFQEIITGIKCVIRYSLNHLQVMGYGSEDTTLTLIVLQNGTGGKTILDPYTHRTPYYPIIAHPVVVNN